MEQFFIRPRYEITSDSGFYGLSGSELTTGEKVSVRHISPDKKFVLKLISVLNKKAVSVHHAKDIIRDIMIGELEERT